MVYSVSGKYAVITGAGSGINLEFARLLLSKGCSVVIADLALRPESRALLDQYPHPPPPTSASSSSSPSSSPPSAIFHQTDVTSWPQLTSLWTLATTAFPHIDIVVNGAGLFEPPSSNFWEPPPPPPPPALDNPSADATTAATNIPPSRSRDDPAAEPGHYATLDVNLVAPIRLGQLAVSHWTRRRLPGVLVCVGSMAGYLSAVNTPLYFASKHGLHGFVRSLGGLKEKLGIRTACVAPGTVRTPMWSEDPDKARMVTPDAEFIEPEEVARAMYELCVDEGLGDGTIYECNAGGARRVIPLFGAEPPTARTGGMPGYYAAQDELYERLRTHGLYA